MAQSLVVTRQQIIERIQTVDDPETLYAVTKLLDLSLDEPVYVTSLAQKEMIALGQQQIAEGKGIPASQADQAIDEWLTE